MKSLEDRIIFARKSMGLSQNFLAERIGITGRTLQRYEKDASKLPLDVMINISNICNVDIIWIISGKENILQKESNISHIDPAIQILNEALQETGVELNEKQKQACLEILREELEKSENKTKEDIKKYLRVFGK